MPGPVPFIRTSTKLVFRETFTSLQLVGLPVAEVTFILGEHSEVETESDRLFH